MPKPTADADALDLAVDRSSPVPLYYQLAQRLEAAIEAGTLAPGGLLGNEIALAARLGLSRPTVRQAIQSLVDKGLLVRRRGVGTQVVHRGAARPPGPGSLYDELEAAGRHPTTTVLVNEARPADAAVAAVLDVPEGAEVRYLERLRLADGEPLALLRDHLPAGLLDLSGDRAGATGLQRILSTAGITLHSARQSVGARLATAEEAAVLGEPEGAAVLTLERTVLDATGRAVTHGTHLYRASRYTFDFQLLVR